MPELKASRLMPQKHIINMLRPAERRALGKCVHTWMVCALWALKKKILIGKATVSPYLNIISSSNIKLSSDPKCQPFETRSRRITAGF